MIQVVGIDAAALLADLHARAFDKPWSEEELAETDSLEALLPKDDTLEDEFIPVRFHSEITELGVFELWCQSTKSAGRWKLEFSVRKDTDS